jgi:DNA-binding GntR family transcriptional regulator
MQKANHHKHLTKPIFAYKIQTMTADIISIPRANLHEQVAYRLRELLVEGHIQPGAKLNERALAEQLNVSRTPLREAIKMLAAEGLVELLPNRGAVAVSLSEQDVVNTFEVMAGLEGMSGALAVQRMTDAELAEIKALHYEMLAAHTRRDLSQYYRLNAQIHRAINTAAKNPVLVATYAQVNARLQALRFRSNLDEAKWKSAVIEHGQMLDALTQRDAPALRQLLEQHLHHKRDAVLEQLRSAPANTPQKARA